MNKKIILGVMIIGLFSIVFFSVFELSYAQCLGDVDQPYPCPSPDYEILRPFDWDNFVIKATNLHLENNFDNYLIFPELKVIVPVVSGLDSLPPSMQVYLYFKYDVANGIDEIKVRYDVDASGILDNEIIISDVSPKKQNDMQIWSYWFDCKIEFVKVMKSSDNSFACVSENTKNDLIERGWAVEFSSKYPPKAGCIAHDKKWNEEFRYCYGIANDICNDLGGTQTCAVDGSPGKSGLEDVCIRVCEFK